MQQQASCRRAHAKPPRLLPARDRRCCSVTCSSATASSPRPPSVEPDAAPAKAPAKAGRHRLDPRVARPARRDARRRDRPPRRRGRRRRVSTSQVGLDPLGAGVRSVSLNAVPRRRPRTAGPPRASSTSSPPPPTSREPAFLLYHYEQKDMLRRTPRRNARPAHVAGRQAGRQGRRRRRSTARRGRRVSFATEIDGVRITKTYSLVAGEYHVGLEVKLERPKPASAIREEDEASRRSSATSSPAARGCPIEGKWYTSIFRNSLDRPRGRQGLHRHRDFQELRSISVGLGGNAVDARRTTASSATPASRSSISPPSSSSTTSQKDQRLPPRRPADAGDGRPQGPGQARLARPGRPRRPRQRRRQDRADGLPAAARRQTRRKSTPQREPLREGVPVAVIYTHAGYDERLKECPRVIADIRVGDRGRGDARRSGRTTSPSASAPRTSSSRRAATVTHKYLLYHGPVKPSLLGQLRGDARRR